jgi:hypothetical protein
MSIKSEIVLVCVTGSKDGDEDTQPLDCRRQVKSIEPVLDILLDMSVASLLTSSSVSGQLSAGQSLARAHIQTG